MTQRERRKKMACDRCGTPFSFHMPRISQRDCTKLEFRKWAQELGVDVCAKFGSVSKTRAQRA